MTITTRIKGKWLGEWCTHLPATGVPSLSPPGPGLTSPIRVFGPRALTHPDDDNDDDDGDDNNDNNKHDKGGNDNNGNNGNNDSEGHHT